MTTTHTPRHGKVPQLDQFIEYVGNAANPQDRYLIKHKGDKTFKYPDVRVTNLKQARAFVQADRSATNKVRTRTTGVRPVVPVASTPTGRPEAASTRYIPHDLNDIVLYDGKQWYVLGGNSDLYPVNDNTEQGAFNYARKCRDVYHTTWPTNVHAIMAYWAKLKYTK